VAKDPQPENGRAKSGPSRGGSGASRATGQRPGQGRTRPPANVVAPQRPWGLIAAAVAVVVFAAAVITYAVVQVNRSNADKVTSADQISGLQTYQYANGQEHVTTEVDYTESPPVGGPHDAYWADCTGTVYTVDIRHENAVHGLEHGAVWITYDANKVTGNALDTLRKRVPATYAVLSPYPGLSAPVVVSAWGAQLKLTGVDDKGLDKFIEKYWQSPDAPEPGAPCTGGVDGPGRI
jgi:hypothetical protein